MDEPNQPRLIKLSQEWRPPFLEMANDWFNSGDDKYRIGRQDFDGYIDLLERQTDQRFIEPHMVPMDTYFLAVGSKLVGSSRLRHRLSPLLEIEGGHIGYDVSPSERRKGYGTLICSLTMELALTRGIRKALITCDTDNLDSARIIEKNGGVFDRYTISQRTGKQVSRYWIDLSGEVGLSNRDLGHDHG